MYKNLKYKILKIVFFRDIIIGLITILYLNSVQPNLIKDKQSKHIEILKDRPLPELLESSEMVETLKEIKPPAMGKLYEEKEKVKEEKNKFFAEE